MKRFKVSRRDALLIAGTAALAPKEAPAQTVGDMHKAMRALLGDAKINKGKVTLDLPPLVENGNTVPMTVTVDSPMTKDNYVKAIHVFNEKNPQPNVVSMTLGPRAGRAHVSTRIRLAGTQNVIAVAQMSDGSCWSDTQEVIVTLAACLEELTP